MLPAADPPACAATGRRTSPETSPHMPILLRAAAAIAAALIALTTAAGILAEAHRAPDGS